jgi:hypothetical protein
MTGEQNGLRQSGLRVEDKGCGVHTALTARQSLDPREILDLPSGSYAWVHSEDSRSQFGSPDRGAIPQGQGDYEDLAKLLFKLNGYRPGPVCGWYVIARTDAGRGWAVGQLCANAFTPVQVFEDMIYPTEAEARARATSLRSNNPGLIRKDKHSDASTRSDNA